MNSRLVGFGLVAAGVAIATLGAVALSMMAGPDTVEATPTPAAAATSGPALVTEPPSVATLPPSPSAAAMPTAMPTPSPAATPSPSPSRADLIAAFVPRLAEALRTGDAAFQIAHLHPDTLARYGGAQCMRELPRLADPTVEITVVEIGPPEAWDYETDGLATRIEAAVPVTVDMTAEGVAARRVLYLTVDAGLVRWFTDCGLPTDTPAP